MSFEGFITNATAMNERLTKARTSGVVDDASQRRRTPVLRDWRPGSDS